MKKLVVFFATIALTPFLWADPLSSWKDTETRRAVVGFVEKVTKTGSPDFVPEAERVAVFDNDGTLWSEQPYYYQLAFTVDTIQAKAAEHPEWKDKEPYASAVKGDYKAMLAMGEKDVAALLAVAHTGMTQDEFSSSVKEWIAKAKHPTTGKPYPQMIFQPMLELLNYLKANGFTNYIVTGGGADFIRQWSEEVYDIPPAHVVGSYGKLKYEVRDGKPQLVKLPELILDNNLANKPVGIQTFIGRRPIIAVGNSDGDFEMLEWTTAGSGARLGMLVHHDDADLRPPVPHRAHGQSSRCRSQERLEIDQHEKRLGSNPPVFIGE